MLFILVVLNNYFTLQEFRLVIKNLEDVIKNNFEKIPQISRIKK